ncbi:MAG: fumarylacetoacetate hydrolase family protein, partial [Alphaproteobacteria bacterium]
ELGVIIGTPAKDVAPEDALDHVWGYTVVNDITARDIQYSEAQWSRCKSFDGFTPTGPFVVTADEVPDPQSLSLFLDVNGQRRQTGTTDKMIFGVAHIISYLSRFMTLLPGDVIVTGTPPGVGSGQKPPVFLKPGDEMHLGIDGLGEQRCKVVAWEDRPR